MNKSSLESYFQQFRENIIGIDQYFESPYGKQKVIYTDWTASGRLYRPIEEKLMNDFGPFVANTHTETNITGCLMTMAYNKAKQGIKEYVNASEHDVLISEGSGMTGVMIKLQRILGFKINDEFRCLPKIIADNKSGNVLEELIGPDKTSCFTVKRASVKGTYIRN